MHFAFNLFTGEPDDVDYDAGAGWVLAQTLGLSCAVKWMSLQLYKDS